MMSFCIPLVAMFTFYRIYELLAESRLAAIARRKRSYAAGTAPGGAFSPRPMSDSIVKHFNRYV